VVIGFAGLVDGPLDAPGAFERAMEKARACGYLGSEPAGPGTGGDR
jgi:urease subunit gamma/beta